MLCHLSRRETTCSTPFVLNSPARGIKKAMPCFGRRKFVVLGACRRLLAQPSSSHDTLCQPNFIHPLAAVPQSNEHSKNTCLFFCLLCLLSHVIAHGVVLAGEFLTAECKEQETDYSLCGKSVWLNLPRKTGNIYVFDVQACWRIHVFGGELSG